MEKFCIFCGGSPQDKNKEHVIPQWLIKLTGDPKRFASFGINMETPLATRRFSFDSLTFPACSECNSRFAQLEAKMEPVMRKLLSEEAVSATEFTLVLDWLDKVRVGLWLGFLYLNKNPLEIKPQFHIERRIAFYDRMVAVLKVDNLSDGLSFLGPMSQFYQVSPTCFALRVNDFYFINASSIDLCSRRLGFPFARPKRVERNGKMEVVVNAGSGRIMSPIERHPPLPNAVYLYQPVFQALAATDIGAACLRQRLGT
jgi:hypothetical protein